MAVDSPTSSPRVAISAPKRTAVPCSSLAAVSSRRASRPSVAGPDAGTVDFAGR